jgi:hypothetical protein
MNASFILIVVLTLVRLWIAVQLFLTARKSKLDNLYWLAAVFGLAAYSLFTPNAENLLSNYVLFHIGVLVSHFCLAAFIHTTFHRDRKSPVDIVFGLLGLAAIMNMYAFSINSPILAAWGSGITVVNWVWHFVVARSAYIKIADDPSVEKWIKSRYILMMTYTLMMVWVTLQSVFFTVNPELTNVPLVLPLGLVMILGSVTLQFLVWVMPEPFRRWLNREKTPYPAQEEPRPRSILDVFSAAMTSDTGLRSMACRYAIRATAGKKLGSEDSATIQRYIDTMNYNDWDAFMQNAELQRILINSGADYNSANRAIDNARHALVEKQSLLTLGAH